MRFTRGMWWVYLLGPPLLIAIGIAVVLINER